MCDMYSCVHRYYVYINHPVPSYTLFVFIFLKKISKAYSIIETADKMVKVSIKSCNYGNSLLKHQWKIIDHGNKWISCETLAFSAYHSIILYLSETRILIWLLIEFVSHFWQDGHFHNINSPFPQGWKDFISPSEAVKFWW